MALTWIWRRVQGRLKVTSQISKINARSSQIGAQSRKKASGRKVEDDSPNGLWSCEHFYSCLFVGCPLSCSFASCCLLGKIGEKSWAPLSGGRRLLLLLLLMMMKILIYLKRKAKR